MSQINDLFFLGLVAAPTRVVLQDVFILAGLALGRLSSPALIHTSQALCLLVFGHAYHGVCDMYRVLP